MDILYNYDWHYTYLDTASVRSMLQGLSFMATSLLGIFLIAMTFFGRRKKKTKDNMANNTQLALLSSIPSYQSTLPYMTFELTRARRYNHTLSVLILGIESGQKEELLKKNKNLANQWGNEQLAAKFLFSLIGTILRESLRDSDILSFELVNDRFVILLTDTDEKKARNAVVRLNNLVNEQIQTQLKAGVAEFPSNGLTIEDLIKYAQTRFNHQPSKNGVMAVHRGDHHKENDVPKNMNDAVMVQAAIAKRQ
ncbi:MAG: diguanylate cyclase domain-containing protein [bacterium]